MCGRYTFFQQQWVDALLDGEPGPLPAEVRRPRYNVAPGQMVLALTRPAQRPTESLEACAVRWGIEAPWKGGPSQLINARAEKLAESRFWRTLLDDGRCVIPADGFYEWRALPSGGKQPYWFGLTDRRPFAFAGLCRERETGPAECAIVTVDANELLSGIHDRMPAILDDEGLRAWLGDDLVAAQAVLEPYPSAAMIARPVSRAVNSADAEGPALIDPVDPPGQAPATQRLF